MQPVYGATCRADEIGTVEARATARYREDGLSRKWLLERFISGRPGPICLESPKSNEYTTC
jgi:hypothetical protein